MIVFWIIAGLMIAAALLFVLPPLVGRRALSGGASHGQANLQIYRDQLRELESDLSQGVIGKEHYAAARAEIERRALDESIDLDEAQVPAQVQWTLVSVIGIALPALAIAMYLAVGTPAALAPGAMQPPADQGHALTPERIQAMISGLAERLKANPEDPEGWVMLAKSYTALGQFNEAAAAYAEAVQRVPNNAQLLVDYADTLGMARGRSLDGEPERLIARALQVDPANVKALALAGTVAFNRKEYSKAAELWRRLLAVLPPEADLARRIQSSLAEAETLAGKEGGKGMMPAAQSSPAESGAFVAGRVQLSQDALRDLSGGETVFVFARAAEGPRMPVAIYRTTVSALPAAFRLDDSTLMSPDRKLSQVGSLVVGARVSRSGSATPSEGDWESDLVPAKSGEEAVNLIGSRKR